MKDLEQAANLLRMAEKDCRALRGMEDAQVFSAEIFGFHVQQAFRYEAFPDLECDRDRRDTIAQVSGLLEHVQDILAHTAP